MLPLEWTPQPAQSSGLQHYQMPRLSPGNNGVPGHPHMAQYILLFHFIRVGLSERAALQLEDLEDFLPAHADLCGILRVKADLGLRKRGKLNIHSSDKQNGTS